MENSMQQQLQKKKKAKNKKNTKVVGPETAACVAEVEMDKCSKKEVNANGLCEQLAHELHINNSGSINNKTVSCNAEGGRKGDNKLANGIAGRDLLHQQVNGHDLSTATTATEHKANGSQVHTTDVDMQQQAKKVKSKSNKLKHKVEEEEKNCHKTEEQHLEKSSVAIERVVAATTATVTLEQAQDTQTAATTALKNGFYANKAVVNPEEEAVDKPAKISNKLNSSVKEVQKNKELPQLNTQQTTEQTQTADGAINVAVAAIPATTASTVNASVASETVLDAASKSELQEEAAVVSIGNDAVAFTLDLSNVQIDYKEYESELQMHDIMRLIQAELSEPYSIYTYRYFIYNWPKLCFLAAHGNEYVGAIVCKLDMHMNVRRGYIAMLAVRKEYRKLKIGTTLVQKAIEAMLADNADEVVLETEMRNLPALRLYENLGFVRDKRLFRYYLNGVDALRLKLWFR